MSWDDDDFGNEFAKFKRAGLFDTIDDYDGNTDVLYCEILYSTLKDYTSQWNKNRKKVQVYTITRCDGSPLDSDVVNYVEGIWLDMGARLFRVVKACKTEKWKYVKILKISNPNDKFDVQYYASQYKLITQKTIDAKKASKTVKK